MKLTDGLSVALLSVMLIIVAAGCGGSSSTTPTTNDTLANAPSGASFTDVNGNTITEVAQGTTAYLSDSSDNKILAFTTSGNVDFSNVTANRSSFASIVHFPSSTDKAGLTGTLILYMPCSDQYDQINICPSATSLADTVIGCEGATTITAPASGSGAYTWDNIIGRAANDDCLLSAAVDDFGTGAYGDNSAFILLTSTDIFAGETIGNAFAGTDCSGSNTSPQLSWRTTADPNIQSYAITVTDPDCAAGCSPTGAPYVHWIIYNMPTTVTSLDRGASVPAGASAGINDYGNLVYDGPCPPTGTTHSYVFKVWGLDVADLTENITINFNSPASIVDGLSGYLSDSASITASYTGN